MFDTKEGQEHRILVLGKLNELMKRWIVHTSVEKVSQPALTGKRWLLGCWCESCSRQFDYWLFVRVMYIQSANQVLVGQYH